MAPTLKPVPTQVLIALGANVPGPAGVPGESLKAAISRLPSIGVAVERVSSFLRTPAFPPSDQPDFLNAAALGQTTLSAAVVLAGLHRIELELGRVRAQPWGPRPIDLDLLAAGELVSEGYWQAAARGDVPGEAGTFLLPHPRMHLRRFVLEPLCEIAPDWIHPALALSAKQMFALIASRDSAR